MLSYDKKVHWEFYCLSNKSTLLTSSYSSGGSLTSWLIHSKMFCPCWELDHGTLVLEATSLPTAPLPWLHQTFLNKPNDGIKSCLLEGIAVKIFSEFTPQQLLAAQIRLKFKFRIWRVKVSQVFRTCDSLEIVSRSADFWNLLLLKVEFFKLQRAIQLPKLTLAT